MDDGSSIPSHFFARPEQRIISFVAQYAPEPLLWLLRADGGLVCLKPIWDRNGISSYSGTRHEIGSTSSEVLEILTDEAPNNITDEVPDDIEISRFVGNEPLAQVTDIFTGYDSTLGRDVLFMMVGRGPERILESLSFSYEPESSTDFAGMYYLDSSTELTVATPKTTWTEFSDYTDRTVTVIADGLVVQEDLYCTGTITLATAASKVMVGYSYSKYFTLLPFAMASAYGNNGTLGRINRITGALLKVRDSYGVTHGDSEQMSAQIVEDFTQNQDILNDDVSLFSGVLRASFHQSRSRDGSIMFSQPGPYPLNILSITLEAEIE